MTLSVPAKSAAAADLPTGLKCAGCGYRVPPGSVVLRCPDARAGDDIDHLITRTLTPARLEWPTGGEANPFIRYRTLFHWYHLARAAGRSDRAIVDDVQRLDDAVAAVDGSGFRVTPLVWHGRLGAWVKDETRNVSGSHKARHLFGTLLALHFAGDDPGRPLAIASCGNAALGAAVVARAARRELLVFVPGEAEPQVVDWLRKLGARVTVCERTPAEEGDPSVRAMRDAVAAGAVPFTCQGNENGIAIEAGLTLGYEIADSLRSTATRLDQLIVQVGGGALAASVIRGLAEARDLGVIDSVPRFHTVQTRAVAPLARAYDLIRDELDTGRLAVAVLDAAARHRSRYMRPWRPVLMSVASGILDDETYDWLAVVGGMLATGGHPVLVDEEELRAANVLAREATRIDVDPTGSAGLAGLLRLRREGEIHEDETCAVLFTGARRSEGEVHTQ